MNEANNIATDVAETLENNGDDIDVDALANEAQDMLDYQVPAEEIKRKLLDKHGSGDGNNLPSPGEASTINIGEINSEGEFVIVEGEIVDLWETNHPENSNAPVQAGLIGDESGVIKFSRWEGDTIGPSLEEGENYRFEAATTDFYNGNYSLNLNESASIHSSDEAVDVNSGTPFAARVMDVAEGTGLILGCPECGGKLNDNDSCYNHGSVSRGEAEHRLRISCTVSDGEETMTLYFDEDQTSEILGLSLEEAKEVAMEQVDMDALEPEVRDVMMGQRVTGRISNISGDRFSVEEVHSVGDDRDLDTEAKRIVDTLA